MSSAVGDLDLAVRRPTLEDVFIELTGRALAGLARCAAE